MDQTKKNMMTDNLRKKPNLSEEIVPEVTVSRKYMEGQSTHCSRWHYIGTCPKFERLTVDERWNWVTKNKVCFCCLSPDHSRKNYDRRVGCGRNGFQLKYYWLLHHDCGGPRSSNSQLSSLAPKIETLVTTEYANFDGKERVNVICKTMLRCGPLTRHLP